MKPVSFDKLKAKIVRPGIERHLVPLTELRGPSHSLWNSHRMWNYSVSMMMHEATQADATQRLGCNERYSQLCMPLKRPDALKLKIFAGSLKARPSVAALEPHLLDYLRYTLRHFIEPWEGSYAPRVRQWSPYQSNSPYPFLVHEGQKPVDPLVALITKAIPQNLPREIKADLCQDLALAVLAGDLLPEHIAAGIRSFLPQIWKNDPLHKWGDKSIQAQIPGTDNLTWEDTLGSEIETF